MSTESPLQLTNRDFKINTHEFGEESLEDKIQGRLRYYYSRRLFVQSVEYDRRKSFSRQQSGLRTLKMFLTPEMDRTFSRW